MIHKPFTRRDFIKTTAAATLGIASGSLFSQEEKSVVSIVKIENDQIDYAVEKAIAAAVPETPISPGEMEISLHLQVAYAIQ